MEVDALSGNSMSLGRRFGGPKVVEDVLGIDMESEHRLGRVGRWTEKKEDCCCSMCWVS